MTTTWQTASGVYSSGSEARSGELINREALVTWIRLDSIRQRKFHSCSYSSRLSSRKRDVSIVTDPFDDKDDVIHVFGCGSG
jgi:hypothetical protein